MRDSYYRDPDVEQQLREDVAAEEKVNTLTPSAEGKAGPDYVEGASEEAQKKLDAVPDNSSLPIWHPEVKAWIEKKEKLRISPLEGEDMRLRSNRTIKAEEDQERRLRRMQQEQNLRSIETAGY